MSWLIHVSGTRIAGSGHGKQRPEHHYVNKLFVFGDSYVDTGNLGRLLGRLARSWFDPYGMTFPRKPTGRFSDGRVLTDYVGLSIPLSLSLA